MSFLDVGAGVAGLTAGLTGRTGAAAPAGLTPGVTGRAPPGCGGFTLMVGRFKVIVGPPPGGVDPTGFEVGKVGLGPTPGAG